MSEINEIQPYVVAALLCDTIIIEAGTGKKTLVGLFDQITSPAFPTAHRFGIYIKLADAQGPYKFRLDYVDLAADAVLERVETGQVDIPDRLKFAELVLTITAGVPHPGTYEFRLYAADAFLTALRFAAIVGNAVEGGLQ